MRHRIHEPRVNRAGRLELCREFGVRYSGRQWRKLRQRLRRATRAAIREKKE